MRSRLKQQLIALALLAVVAASCSSAATSAATGETPTTATPATSPPPRDVPPITSETPASTPATSITPTTAQPVTTTPPVCTAADLPPNPNAPSIVRVTGIESDDVDKGLNIRFDPTTASGVQFALPNGTSVTATGGCEVSVDGGIWWAIEGDQWTGWANASFLLAAGPTQCNAGNFNPVGKDTIETILGDYDGDGQADALFLSYDGVVQPPNLWSGTTATLQIQYADGGLSTEFNVTALLGDGGPEIGVSNSIPFPDRIEFGGSDIEAAFLGSTYSGSATGAGRAHLVWSAQCEPVMASFEVNPSVGFPQRPVLCDVDAAGRVEVYALDGVTGNLDFLLTPHQFVVDQLIPQAQITAGNALATDPESAVC